MPEWSDQEFLRTVFDETRVIRTPLRGIIAGYHVLPYVLLGPAEYDRTSKTVEVRGRIRVSPRLVLGGNAPTYGEMFGDERLKDLLIKYQKADSSELIARTMEAVVHWTGAGELQDDMTMVVVRRI